MTLKAVATESLAASGITVGTGASAITGGTNTRVLFDDNGVVGESAGLTYVKASGTLTYTIGVISTSLAIGGATIGSNALAITGTFAFSGAGTIGGSLTFTAAAAGTVFKQGANGRVGTFVANGATPVTVSNTGIAITDAIVISLNAVGGAGPITQPVVLTITAGVGFTVGASATDSSTYNYAILKNAA